MSRRKSIIPSLFTMGNMLMGFVSILFSAKYVSAYGNHDYLVIAGVLIFIGAIFDATGKETLSSYKGLYKSNPALALIFALSLFSLAGIPPTAGFFGKLFLLTAGMGNGMYVLLGVAGINLVLSLYNYLRVVKTMFIDDAVETLPSVERNFALKIALIVCVIGLVAIGFIAPIYQYFESLSFNM